MSNPDKILIIDDLSNATQALSELEQNNDYQLILVDLKMPSMSGLDFIRALNSRSINARVCVVSQVPKTLNSFKQRLMLGLSDLFRRVAQSPS